MIIVSKQRNAYVDILRGIAILLVVLGHTLTTCTENSQDTVLYNMIWSLQMPLFFLISGYVSIYSKPIENAKDLVGYIFKKVNAYLIPWFVWTFLIRGVIFGQHNFFSVDLFWHMDTGYWFLMSLWVIVIIFACSNYIANRLLGHQSKNNLCIFLQCVFFAFGSVFLIILGFVFGFSFLGIKLTLYYMPFYLCGWLFGIIRNNFDKEKWWNKCTEAIVFCCCLLYFFVVYKYNLYEIADSEFGVVIRAVASFCGCVSLCHLCRNINMNTKISRLLQWFGVHSLEIYLVHYLLLSIIRLDALPHPMSLLGVCLIGLNFVVTILLCAVVTYLLNQNNVIKMVCFGKR